MKPTILFIFSIMFVLTGSSACSVYKASTQPGPANIQGIGIGSSRQEVITRLGPPKFSDNDSNGQKQEIFEFQSGLHHASKARVIPYIAADLFTLGLAELILWPMELTVMERATCVAIATYDKSQKVDTWTLSKKSAEGGAQDC